MRLEVCRELRLIQRTYIMPTPIEHRVFIPQEHGSWSLAFEPIFFGLLVAPTAAGGVLALCATAAFFMRRPLKSFLKHQDRASAFALTLLSLGVSIGLAEMILLGDFHALWPLLPALPLGLLYLHWDRKNENRAAAAELTGISLFALIPAAMATLSGQSMLFALSLTTLMLARSAPAVLTVRTWLRQRKGQQVQLAPAVLTTLAFIMIVLGFALLGSVPIIAVGFITFSSVRLYLLSPQCPQWPARRVGLCEAIFGVIYLSAVATAFHYQA
jgi:hypothetical protein